MSFIELINGNRLADDSISEIGRRRRELTYLANDDSLISKLY